jgi:hypothetical protein
MLPPQHQEIGVLRGNHVRRARLIVDQRHLPEEVSGAQDRQDDLAAVLADQHHLHLTRQHHVEGVSGVVLEQDDAVLGVGALPRHLGDAGDFRLS